MKDENKKIRLALLGFGNAGQAFAALLASKRGEIKERYGKDVQVTAIATASKGNLLAASGASAAAGEAGEAGAGAAARAEEIDIDAVLADLAQHGRFTDRALLCELDTMEIVKTADYDVLIEMTPLNILSGRPAIDHIEAAFARGKHVITANKGPIAWKFRDLQQQALRAGCGFFYETTVMDGTPVFNLCEKTLPMAQVSAVSGILNSTTNFILEELARGAAYDDIMERGRAMGFIEADPAMDIEGYDAAAKITALLNVLMDAGLTPDQVERKGIENITAADIKNAAERGKVIKLICRGWRDGEGRIRASVRPEEVDAGDMLASVNSTTSVVSITTDLMKTVSIVEHEPEIEQTAYGIFGDLLRVLSEC